MKKNKQILNPAEAVMGFAAWLTSQPQQIIMSSHDLASPACEAVGLFCEANGFSMSDIRDNYYKILIHPTKPIPYVDEQSGSLKTQIDAYKKALEQIALSCDGTNVTHYIIWTIADNALKG